MFGIGLFEDCVQIINHWIPKEKYTDELKFRDDLMSFLNVRLNKPNDLLRGNRQVRIKKEDGRGLCDIGLGNSQVGIELKKDLKSKSQIDRLSGQIDTYKEGYSEGVIIVLIGNSDEYAETDLRQRLKKKLNEGLGIQMFRIKLINKSEYNLKRKKKQSNTFSGFGDLNLRF